MMGFVEKVRSHSTMIGVTMTTMILGIIIQVIAQIRIQIQVLVQVLVRIQIRIQIQILIRVRHLITVQTTFHQFRIKSTQSKAMNCYSTRRMSITTTVSTRFRM